MTDLLAALLPIALSRGDNPDGGSGVLIIVGVIVAIVLVFAALAFLFVRSRGPGRG